MSRHQWTGWSTSTTRFLPPTSCISPSWSTICPCVFADHQNFGIKTCALVCLMPWQDYLLLVFCCAHWWLQARLYHDRRLALAGWNEHQRKALLQWATGCKILGGGMNNALRSAQWELEWGEDRHCKLGQSTAEPNTPFHFFSCTSGTSFAVEWGNGITKSTHKSFIQNFSKTADCLQTEWIPACSRKFDKELLFWSSLLQRHQKKRSEVSFTSLLLHTVCLSVCSMLYDMAEPAYGHGDHRSLWWAFPLALEISNSTHKEGLLIYFKNQLK